MDPQIIYDLGNVPDWITAIATVGALIGVGTGLKDFLERTRPYVDIEIETVIDKRSGNWSFLAKVLNKGKYPVYSKISKALLIIGDEKYPTLIDKELVIFPGEDKKITTRVGYINNIGREKIRGAKYTKNIVKLILHVSSRKIKEKDFKYKTKLEVLVLVEEDKPGFILLKKVFI